MKWTTAFFVDFAKIDKESLLIFRTNCKSCTTGYWDEISSDRMAFWIPLLFTDKLV